MDKLITLNDVTVRLGDRFLLPHTNWEIKQGEHWAVLGPNGAGKSTLVRALTGDVPCVRGRLTYHGPLAERRAIGYVSWEEQERVIAGDYVRDASRDFSRQADGYETVRTTVLSGVGTGTDNPPELDDIAALTGIGNLLDRYIRFLSTGEMRKVLVARALLKSPQLMILDEPFDGVDTRSRISLTHTIQALAAEGMSVIFVTHHPEELPPSVSRILFVKNGETIRQGARNDILRPEVLDELYGDGKRGKASGLIDRPSWRSEAGENTGDDMVIEMRDVTVRYGETTVLDRLNWSVRRGENWAVSGPSGSGKTTLLRLIAGDHPQAYANDIRLFGKPRGDGESIWEIKVKMGVVSAEIQIGYRKGIRTEEVVASGLFDSIGLYRRLSLEQTQQVARCMHSLGLTAMKDRLFNRLSSGERRMVLLARAMVKSPDVLVLDEPCQGLDRGNRRFILETIQDIGSRTPTQLLYVTHYPEEVPPCIRHVLHLAKPESCP